MNYQENLGYAGFLFKKTVQPNPLRSYEMKSPIDFLESNIFVFINKKIKELKQSTGKKFIPHEFFQDLTIPFSIQKKFSKQQIMNGTGQKAINNSTTNLPNSIYSQKKTNQAKNNTKHFVAKKSKRLITCNSPEKKVRNVLYEKISENNFDKCFELRPLYCAEVRQFLTG